MLAEPLNLAGKVTPESCLPSDCIIGSVYKLDNFMLEKKQLQCSLFISLQNALTYLFPFYLCRESSWDSEIHVTFTRACYTKSGREKQIAYIKAYIWDLEKWYWWTYLQGKNGDSDIENRLVDTVGEGESEANGGSSIDVCVLLSCVK